MASAVGHHHAHPLAGGDVQELVRAVCVGMRAKHARDEELGARELLAEHAHERDRAAFAHVGRGLAEVVHRRGVERNGQPVGAPAAEPAKVSVYPTQPVITGTLVAPAASHGDRRAGRHLAGGIRQEGIE